MTGEAGLMHLFERLTDKFDHSTPRVKPVPWLRHRHALDCVIQRQMVISRINDEIHRHIHLS